MPKNKLDMQKVEDRLLELGIIDSLPFELNELSGRYIYHKEKMAVYDITNILKPTLVQGLINNLLAGKYHKKGRR